MEGRKKNPAEKTEEREREGDGESWLLAEDRVIDGCERRDRLQVGISSSALICLARRRSPAA